MGRELSVQHGVAADDERESCCPPSISRTPRDELLQETDGGHSRYASYNTHGVGKGEDGTLGPTSPSRHGIPRIREVIMTPISRLQQN